MPNDYSTFVDVLLYQGAELKGEAGLSISWFRTSVLLQCMSVVVVIVLVLNNLVVTLLGI